MDFLTRYPTIIRIKNNIIEYEFKINNINDLKNIEIKNI